MKYVCVHGHFYQPPRGNPWQADAVPEQPSAAPFHDWNERITAECYEPNTAAYLLNGSGEVRAVRNNFFDLSFNVGPTLFEWMEQHAPHSAKAIITADARSRSAIAQAYNHTILPLASTFERRVQVVWGIAAFVATYGRKPRGMWLPECAVDLATLDALAAQDVEFTVLPPRAAADDKPLDRPYWVALPSGRRMCVFFYNGPLSQAVAFEKLLDNGDRLAERIAETARDGGLLSIATDGESFGHHHRHGEMALAYAFERLRARGDVQVTHFGAYLDAHPPDDSIKLVPLSSWSCEHGVERWRSDCGCQTHRHPNATQRWRAPLRAALSALAEELDGLLRHTTLGLLRDTEAALLASPTPPAAHDDAFFVQHAARPLDATERTRLSVALAMHKQRQLMFTSCAWFFDEPSDLETVQVLLHAGFALELGEQLGLAATVREQFLSALDACRCAVGDVETARELFMEATQRASVDWLIDGLAVSPARNTERLLSCRHLLLEEPRRRRALAAMFAAESLPPGLRAQLAETLGAAQ